MKKLIGVRLDDYAIDAINKLVEMNNQIYARKINFSEMLRDLIDLGISEKNEELKFDLSKMKQLKENKLNSQLDAPIITNIENKKVGRNSPCPCGSGKKYKNCCGK